ncbi:MAG: Bro-N domain-containing protein, partial [Fibromonadales bacterium]|nr:Bro-N domain-containing protein [Fibromonadales bacterium]
TPRQNNLNFGGFMDSNKIQLFENRKVRSVWDTEKEEWFFSVVDVVAVLTEQATPRSASNYWAKLKERLADEGSQLLTNCQQLKMPASDGKNYLTDVATTEQLFRIIQSIPSPKAEPFKLWLAKVGNERLNQMQDPEKSIKQAMQDYKNLGYSDSWINQRLKSMEVRKELTDEWKNKGLKEEVHFAALTDIITKTWSGKTTKEYKQFKNLKKENLRDNMTNAELVLNMLAEISTKSISESSNPKTLKEHKNVAKRGGEIALNARKELEQKTGKKAISNLNAKMGILTISH